MKANFFSVISSPDFRASLNSGKPSFTHTHTHIHASVIIALPDFKVASNLFFHDSMASSTRGSDALVSCLDFSLSDESGPLEAEAMMLGRVSVGMFTCMYVYQGMAI